MGTQMREGVEMLIKDFPEVNSTTVLSLLGAFKYIHSGVGFLLLALVYKLYKYRFEQPKGSLIIKLIISIYYIVVFQIIIGEFMVFFDFTATVRLLHMWLSSIILGFITIMIACIHSINIKLKYE